MWDIVCEGQNEGLLRGKALPFFIHNLDYHLTTVNVYEDGAIDAWGFLDLPLFDAKCKQGWVCAEVPDGQEISIFNLGRASVSSASWRLSSKSIYKEVVHAIRAYNPKMKDLIDMKGEATEPLGKIRRAKFLLKKATPVYKNAEGTDIFGDEIPVFRCEEKEYHLLRWFLFADGMARLGVSGEIQPWEAIRDELLAGRLCLQVPDGAWIVLGSLGSFQASSGLWYVSPKARTLEAEDLLRQMRGQKSSVALCREAWFTYEATPSDPAKEALLQAYLAVPRHLRLYCGDMDTKDSLIRRVLLGLLPPETD